MIKQQPQAQEIENAVLGAIILENERLIEVMQVLPSADVFYSLNGQKIYAAILRMYERGQKVDLLTVNNELTKTNEVLDTDGTTAYYLTKLMNAVVSTAHVIQHSYVILEKFLLREMIRISGEITERAYEGEDPFILQADFLEQFNKAFEARSRQVWVHIQQAASRFMKQRDEVMQNGGKVGITTTFSKLDHENGGFRPGQLIIIGARPSVGKSAISGDMVIAWAKQGLPVGVINLEMPIEEIGEHRKRQVEKLDNSGRVIAVYGSLKEAAQDSHISPACISQATRGLIPTAAGFKWRKKQTI